MKKNFTSEAIELSKEEMKPILGSANIEITPCSLCQSKNIVVLQKRPQFMCFYASIVGINR